MKIYFDENFPPQLAHSLSILQRPKFSEEKVQVFNIADEFGRGALDEDWIPRVAKLKGIVVTQDINIHRRRQQRELYRENNLGVVFLKSPSKSGYKYWDMVNQIYSAWSDIKRETFIAKRPFAYILKPRSRRLSEL